MRKQRCKLYLLAVLFFIACITLNAQTDTTGITIQRADFRGKRPQTATVAAISASQQKVIVILLRGADSILIQEMEGNIKGLIRSGFTRIGLVLGDSYESEQTPVISIYADGNTYAVIQDVNSSSNTHLSVFNLVRDAYNKIIGLER